MIVSSLFSHGLLKSAFLDEVYIVTFVNDPCVCGGGVSGGVGANGLFANGVVIVAIYYMHLIQVGWCCFNYCLFKKTSMCT